MAAAKSLAFVAESLLLSVATEGEKRAGLHQTVETHLFSCCPRKLQKWAGKNVCNLLKMSSCWLFTWKVFLLVIFIWFKNMQRVYLPRFCKCRCSWDSSVKRKSSNVTERNVTYRNGQPIQHAEFEKPWLADSVQGRVSLNAATSTPKLCLMLDNWTCLCNAQKCLCL